MIFERRAGAALLPCSLTTSTSTANMGEIQLVGHMFIMPICLFACNNVLGSLVGVGDEIETPIDDEFIPLLVLKQRQAFRNCMS